MTRLEWEHAPGAQWLVKVNGMLDGELFRMNSVGKWCWLRHHAWLEQQAGESMHETIYRNGYMKAETLEDARREIARRAGAAADEVQLELNDTR
jgi:hypothetical protein